jgi:hypothetical protein
MCANGIESQRFLMCCFETLSQYDECRHLDAIIYKKKCGSLSYLSSSKLWFNTKLSLASSTLQTLTFLKSNLPFHLPRITIFELDMSLYVCLFKACHAHHMILNPCNVKKKHSFGHIYCVFVNVQFLCSNIQRRWRIHYSLLDFIYGYIDFSSILLNQGTNSFD